MHLHTEISVFRTSIYAVFIIDRTQKQMLLIKLLNFFLLKISHRSVSQTYKL